MLDLRIKTVIVHKQMKDPLEKLTDESREKSNSLEQTIREFGGIFHHWQRLPEDIRESLGDILLNFDTVIDFLDDDLKETLLQMTNQFGKVLAKFSTLSLAQVVMDEEGMESRLKLLKNLALFNTLTNFDLINLAEQMEDWSLFQLASFANPE